MDYKKSYHLIRASFLFMTALMLVGGFLSRSTLLIFVIGVAGAIWIIYLGKFCCCPHCGGEFSTREKLPDYCPHCGEMLE